MALLVDAHLWPCETICFLFAGVSCTQGENKMSGTENDDVKEQELAENAHKNQVDGDKPEEGLNSMEKSDDNPMPSPEQEVYCCFCINFQFDLGYKKQEVYKIWTQLNDMLIKKLDNSYLMSVAGTTTRIHVIRLLIQAFFLTCFGCLDMWISRLLSNDGIISWLWKVL